MQMLDFLLSEIVQILILRQSMHHSPTLLSQLAYLIKNRNILIIIDKDSYNAKRNEGSSASNPRTAMHHRNRFLSNRVYKSINQKVKRVLAFFAWNIPIRPISELVVIYSSYFASFGIFKLQFFQFQFFFIIYQFLFQQSNLVFLLYQLAAMWVLLRKITITFYFVLFDQVAEHENIFYLILLDHPPNIIEAVGEGTLSGDRFFSLYLNDVGVQIILNLIFFLFASNNNPRRLESHICSIAIVRKLLRIFKKFIDMVLSLSHKAKKFEFCCKTSFQPFQAKIDLRYFFTHMFKIFVLKLPLLRYIIVHYRKCFLKQ